MIMVHSILYAWRREASK